MAAGDTQCGGLLSQRLSLALEGKTQFPYHRGVSAQEPALREAKGGVTQRFTPSPEWHTTAHPLVSKAPTNTAPYADADVQMGTHTPFTIS